MTIKNYSKQCLMISAGIMVLALLLGFAKTLLLGVIVSLFSALLVTRFLMKQFIQLKNWNVSAFTSGVQSAKEAK